MGTGSFLGVKRLGRGSNHQLLSSAEGKERVELYLFPLRAFMAAFEVCHSRCVYMN